MARCGTRECQYEGMDLIDAGGVMRCLDCVEAMMEQGGLARRVDGSYYYPEDEPFGEDEIEAI